MQTAPTSTDLDQAWLLRLKEAADWGYYKTEPAIEEQTGFPWQNKTCRHCPFWANGICRVHAEYRPATAHTCTYFDDSRREAAHDIIRERQMQGYRRWWDWFNSR